MPTWVLRLALGGRGLSAGGWLKVGAALDITERGLADRDMACIACVDCPRGLVSQPITASSVASDLSETIPISTPSPMANSDDENDEKENKDMLKPLMSE